MAKASADTALNARRTRTVEDVAICIAVGLKMAPKKDAFFIIWRLMLMPRSVPGMLGRGRHGNALHSQILSSTALPIMPNDIASSFVIKYSGRTAGTTLPWKNL
jgi:hypothetical protein